MPIAAAAPMIGAAVSAIGTGVGIAGSAGAFGGGEQEGLSGPAGWRQPYTHYTQFQLPVEAALLASLGFNPRPKAMESGMPGWYIEPGGEASYTKLALETLDLEEKKAIAEVKKSFGTTAGTMRRYGSYLDPTGGPSYLMAGLPFAISEDVMGIRSQYGIERAKTREEGERQKLKMMMDYLGMARGSIAPQTQSQSPDYLGISRDLLGAGGNLFAYSMLSQGKGLTPGATFYNASRPVDLPSSVNFIPGSTYSTFS